MNRSVPEAACFFHLPNIFLGVLGALSALSPGGVRQHASGTAGRYPSQLSPWERSPTANLEGPPFVSQFPFSQFPLPSIHPSGRSLGGDPPFAVSDGSHNGPPCPSPRQCSPTCKGQPGPALEPTAAVGTIAGRESPKAFIHHLFIPNSEIPNPKFSPVLIQSLSFASSISLNRVSPFIWVLRLSFPPKRSKAGLAAGPQRSSGTVKPYATAVLLSSFWAKTFSPSWWSLRVAAALAGACRWASVLPLRARMPACSMS